MSLQTIDFTSKAYGKWILSGEHSVLRGGEALVFPLPYFEMKFHYKRSLTPFCLKYKGIKNKVIQDISLSVLERVKEFLNFSKDFSFQGDLLIESNIPVGEGLGSSAAFCVNAVRWFEYLGLLKKEELFTFAKRLEDLFHGESSGLDVALALKGKALRFRRYEKNYQNLEPRWKPYFYLSHSGKKSITSQCVKKVKRLIARKPKEGETIDDQMNLSVQLARKALESEKSEASLKLLVKALHLSRKCFQSWGLTEGDLEEKMHQIMSLGALATKPTGSGKGGYILSLWDAPLQGSLKKSFFPCF